MRKKNNFAEQLQNIASEIIEVLYKILKGFSYLFHILGKVKRLFHFFISFKISIVYSLLFFFLDDVFFLIMGFFAIQLARILLKIWIFP
jgi:hypothetical protein